MAATATDLYQHIDNTCRQHEHSCRVLECTACHQVIERHMTALRALDVADDAPRDHVCAA